MTSYNVKAFTVVNLYSIRALQSAAEGRLYNAVFADTPSIRRIQCGERERVRRLTTRLVLPGKSTASSTAVPADGSELLRGWIECARHVVYALYCL